MAALLAAALAALADALAACPALAVAVACRAALACPALALAAEKVVLVNREPGGVVARPCFCSEKII